MCHQRLMNDLHSVRPIAYETKAISLLQAETCRYTDIGLNGARNPDRTTVTSTLIFPDDPFLNFH